ncbi:MAG TPA: ThiF family adenylyltransferase [Candidatus Acidoferrales bacterium]|nr:ThiF family adenylyltransferase [Candidatus Acidoferrales bacterium]
MSLRGHLKPMKPKLYERYSRQILFTGIGERGQERLLASRVALVGCGALGTAIANLLVRAGVGALRVIDRDFVEESNLQRQMLFEEADARESFPKAVAAERRLRAINAGVQIEGIVADVTPANAEDLLAGFDLLLDGTDNFETRFLVNDVAVKLRIPWIYSAVVASYGVTLPIHPGRTACLACLAEPDKAPGAPGLEDTCDTVGVLGPAAGVAASLAAGEAMKILTLVGDRPPATRLVSCDVWTGQFRSVQVVRDANCRACIRREFRYLEGEAVPHITLCGRDSVQIHEHGRALDLVSLEKQLAPVAANVRQNGFLLRFSVNSYEVTVFSDGRAIIKGTKDPAAARALYARYLGA